ncbi:MAG: hypothetical protein J6B77_10185, partial [Clostridia bacterium]|nr:hypothetical protein [Clostridia bacterium]
MKMKRTLTVLMALVMVFLMLPLQALALTVTAKISEVELTLPAPVAGELASRDASIVTVKHHMSYKVTTVNWMKHPSEEYLGVNNAEKYFVGGQTYTVYITLAVKGANSGWNIDYKGTDTDYSGIKATVNGETAEVTHLTLNPDAKTILVKYTFELIPKREITPSVTVPAPTAGDMPPSLDAIKVGNELGLNIAPSEYLWYENDGKSNDCGAGWRKMQSGEAFVAGRNYRVTLAVQANEGFLFPVKSAHDVNGTKYIYGFINGRKISMRVNYIGVNDIGEAVYNDTVAYVTYDFLSCKAKEIGSVSFSGFTIPARGEKPSYTAPTMGDATYALVTDDAISGGAEYGFKNGLSWTTV